MRFSNKLTLLTLAAFYSLSLATSIAGQISPEESTQELWVVPGKSLNILVKASENHVIQFCRWDATGPNSKTGLAGITFVNKDADIPSTMISAQAEETQQSIDGYSYYGGGLSNGECGITLDSVSDADITLWKCLIIEYEPHSSNPTADHKTQLVNLQQAVAPTPPVISDKSTAHLLKDTGNGIQSRFCCCAESGVPDPELRFLFDNRVIDQSVTETHSHLKVCITWEDAKFSRADNKKRLICESNHVTSSDLTPAEKQDYIELDISFGPEILTPFNTPQNKSIFVNLSTGNRKLEISYSSNPRACVTWYVQEGDEFYREITNGGEFYAASTELQDKEHSYIATLELKTYDIKESKNVFKVKLENEIGSEEIFLVNTDKPQIVIVPNPGEYNDSGFNWYWLIYLGIALLVLLIIVTTYIILAKRNGWLCYRNKVGQYDAVKSSKLANQPEKQSGKQHAEVAVEVDDTDTGNNDRVYNSLVASAV